MNNNSPKKILVIKLGALGDFMLAINLFQAIRRHHPDAQITLLTTKLFKDMAQRSGCFNNIILDVKPKFYEVGKVITLAQQLNKPKFDMVYDLQMNDRTHLYRRLMRNKPAWFGDKDAPHEHPHAHHRLNLRLSAAGAPVSAPDLSFMNSDISLLNIKKPFVLLVPGSAPTRPDKRWPAMKYGALAKKLQMQGYETVVLGTAAEREVIERIMKSCPGIHDLSGRTSFYDIISLGREAAGAVGNDTGPTHMLSLAGCPVLALFSHDSDPERSAPVGDNVAVLRVDNLDTLGVNEVFDAFKPRA